MGTSGFVMPKPIYQDLIVALREKASMCIGRSNWGDAADAIEQLRQQVADLTAKQADNIVPVVEHTPAPIADDLKANEEAKARMLHDFPLLTQFFSKHALGSKLATSCFMCGHVGERYIAHLELADIYICKTCVDRAALSAPAQQDVATLTSMKSEDGRKGYYIYTPEIYCDIEPDENGVWSVYFRDRKTGKEAFGEKPMAVPQDVAKDVLICGENKTPLDADLVGCGKPITHQADVYRCTDCEVPFHKECSKRHFATDTPEHAASQFEEQLRRIDAAVTAQSKDAGKDGA